ncbi:MAG: Ribosome-binding factor A [Candidatus Anoxychlamydiales bacterium]|nr:Ribosome-binding factor A [Candidatus Anoxychlamydiales bacterium]
MKNKRQKRLNSLLKEVISEVIAKDIANPNVSNFISVMQVDIKPDLHSAVVSISIIGSGEEKKKTIDALNKASGFISSNASKKVVLRYFPTLTFELDTSVDKFMKIDSILQEIEKEKKNRKDQ